MGLMEVHQRSPSVLTIATVPRGVPRGTPHWELPLLLQYSYPIIFEV